MHNDIQSSESISVKKSQKIEYWSLMAKIVFVLGLFVEMIHALLQAGGTIIDIFVQYVGSVFGISIIAWLFGKFVSSKKALNKPFPICFAVTFLIISIMLTLTAVSNTTM